MKNIVVVSALLLPVVLSDVKVLLLPLLPPVVVLLVRLIRCLNSSSHEDEHLLPRPQRRHQRCYDEQVATRMLLQSTVMDNQPYYRVHDHYPTL